MKIEILINNIFILFIMRKNTFILLCLFMLVSIFSAKAQSPLVGKDADLGSTEASYLLYANTTNMLTFDWNWGNGETQTPSAVGGNNYLGVTLPANAGYGAGLQYSITGNLTAATVNAYTRIRFDVWVPSTLSGDIASIRFRDALDSEIAEIPIRDLTGGQWTTIDVPLSGLFSSLPAAKLIVQAANQPSTVIMALDNILLYTPPMPAAPTPSLTSPVVIWDGVNSGWSTNATAATAGGNPCRQLVLASANGTYTTSTAVSTRNALHVQVYAKTLPTSLQIKLNSGTAVTVSTSGLVANQWNTVQIPLSQFGSIGTTITSVNFTGAGTIWVDNIILYSEDGNLSPVADLYQGSTLHGSFNSIKAAHDYMLANLLTGAITIRVKEDSKEPNQIVIDPEHGGSQYTSLTIYPTKILTVTYTGSTGNLFAINNKATSTRTITIDGRANAAGNAIAMTIKMPWTKTTGEVRSDGAAIAVNGTPDVNIRYCKFTGVAVTDRPRSMIKVMGTNLANIKIEKNNFDNCLLMDARLSSLTSPALDEVETAGVIYIDGLGIVSPGGLLVDDNHFYESTQEYFRSPIVRAYIYLRNMSEAATPIKITNNKIGGSGPNLAGSLKVGSTSAPPTSPAGHVHGISIDLGYPGGAADSGPYVLVENNEIANINLYNISSGVFANDNEGEKISTRDQYAGGFIGINMKQGRILTRNNIIREITLTSAPATGNLQRFMFAGISSSIFGGNSRAIIEDNQLYNFTVDYTANGPNYSTLINGIFCQIDNDGSTKPITTVRNNRVIMRHRGTRQTFSYTNIHGISARVQYVQGNSPAQMDVYNNVVVLEECKYTGSLRVISPMDVVNGAASANGVINLYSNIFAVAPVASGFTGVTALVAGINYVAEANTSGTTNIFHNTVFMREYADLGAGGPVAALNMEYREASGAQSGNLSVWNNNFINGVVKGNASVFYSNSPYAANRPKTVYFDYNNYFVPSDGYMFRNAHGTTIKTFDNWKFSNVLPYLSKTTEHDHHTQFGHTNITGYPITLSMAGLETAKTAFAPPRFVAGRRTNPSTHGLRVTSTTAGSHAVGITNMADNTNMDINGVRRRTYLPTVGAANTTFTNYWTGTAFVNATPTATHATDAYRDIVFAENASAHFTMTADMMVRHIYNDTQRNLNVANYTLVIQGYIGQEYPSRNIITNVINATGTSANVIMEGNQGHVLTSQPSGISNKRSAAAQHLFKNTFYNNRVNNLHLNNFSEYFVLLHDVGTPANTDTEATLVLMNDFANRRAGGTANTVNYPDGVVGKHMGGLNCTWYNTTLYYMAGGNRTPNLSSTSISPNNDYTYRPYSGRRIPRHTIFNDSVYNLTVATNKLVTYHDYLYVKNNLNITSTGSFEIAADKYVRVFGTTSNSGGNAGLVVKSREVGTAETNLHAYLFPTLPRPNATFIYTPANNPTNTIPATVEMFSPAQQVASTWKSPGGNTYEYRWQYFGTPINTLSSVVSGSTVYEYYPTGNNNLAGTGTGSPYWRAITGNFLIGQGYCIYNSANKVYSWTGNLISANQSKPLTYTISPITAAQINNTWKDFVRADGQHLLSNPYTAAIDITRMTMTNTDGTIYLYNTGSYAEFNGGTNTYDVQPGKTLSVPVALAGSRPAGVLFDLPRFIPSMQAFTVKVNSGQTATVGFTYNAVAGNIGKNDTPQRSAAFEPEMSSLRVDLNRDGQNDWALLLTHPDCKKGFDFGWDGRTTPDKNLPFSIFTIEEEAGVDLENSYYQISTMDNFDGVYLGILVNNDMRSVDSDETQEPVYELVFNHELEGTALQLEDLLLKKTVDISEPGASYTFAEPTSGEIQKRFRISLRNTTDIPNDFSAQASKVYSYGKTILIEHPAEAGSVWVYDVAGKCILTTDLAADNQTRLDTGLQPGVYLVKVTAGGKTINTRIILK